MSPVSALRAILLALLFAAGLTLDVDTTLSQGRPSIAAAQAKRHHKKRRHHRRRRHKKRRRSSEL
jgi:hypothetical protein